MSTFHTSSDKAGNEKGRAAEGANGLPTVGSWGVGEYSAHCREYAERYHGGVVGK